MNSIQAALAASSLTGIGLLSGAAVALPGAGLAPTGNIEEVRLVCDVYGRCYRTRPPVVRVLPGPAYRLPPYGGPVYGGPRDRGPDFGVRGRLDGERRRDGGEGNGRDRSMGGGDRENHGAQGQRYRRDEGGDGRGQGQMQGDRGEGGTRGHGRQGGQNRGRRFQDQGDYGDQRGGGDEQ